MGSVELSTARAAQRQREPHDHEEAGRDAEHAQWRGPIGSPVAIGVLSHDVHGFRSGRGPKFIALEQSHSSSTVGSGGTFETSNGSRNARISSDSMRLPEPGR